jgi:hypothetical protein
MILLSEIVHELGFEPLDEMAPPIANYDDYIGSMNKSIGEKTWFVNKLDFDCLVDFGCADGTLLKKVHEMKPEAKLIGYDIDPGMEARFKKNNPELDFTSKFSDAVKVARKFSAPAILLSSVIHEVYSYADSTHQLNRFWKDVFGSGFKYVIIRDTIPDRIDIVKPKEFAEDVAKVKAKVDPKYLEDFEKKWGPIDKSYRLFVRFILTYRYKDNWDRESLENYMPLSYSTLLRRIPSNYKIVDGANYKFQPVAANFKDEYDIVLRVNTHLSMILSRA